MCRLRDALPSVWRRQGFTVDGVHIAQEIADAIDAHVRGDVDAVAREYARMWALVPDIFFKREKAQWLYVLERATDFHGSRYSSGDRDYAYEWPMHRVRSSVVVGSPFPDGCLPVTGLFLAVLKRDTEWLKQMMAWCYDTSDGGEGRGRHGFVSVGPSWGTVSLNCMTLARALGYAEIVGILNAYKSYYMGSLMRVDGGWEKTVPAFVRRDEDEC